MSAIAFILRSSLDLDVPTYHRPGRSSVSLDLPRANLLTACGYRVRTFDRRCGHVEDLGVPLPVEHARRFCRPCGRCYAASERLPENTPS
ncbi:MAG: hypothetical protein LC798_13710 [Chloroflexi bacterium]|nr:hypothetical protein [Chloroflexota bacterium]